MSFTAQRQVINGVTVVAVVLVGAGAASAGDILRPLPRFTKHTNQDNVMPPAPPGQMLDMVIGRGDRAPERDSRWIDVTPDVNLFLPAHAGVEWVDGTETDEPFARLPGTQPEPPASFADYLAGESPVSIGLGVTRRPASDTPFTRSGTLASPIPAPGAIGLLALGGLALTGRRRRH